MLSDAERWWVLWAGVAGLVLFVVGHLTSRWPLIDARELSVVHALRNRRTSLLVGTMSQLTGSTLLLWPLVAVAFDSASTWLTLGLFSIVAWVVAFGFLTVGALAGLAAAWRGPDDLPLGVVRALLDVQHLATWPISAPAAAIAVVASTAAGVQGHLFSRLVVVAAVLKVITVIIELVGTGRRRGWNAGGWAGGTSGYATVAWFALVLYSIGVAPTPGLS